MLKVVFRRCIRFVFVGVSIVTNCFCRQQVRVGALLRVRVRVFRFRGVNVEVLTFPTTSSNSRMPHGDLILERFLRDLLHGLHITSNVRHRRRGRPIN